MDTIGILIAADKVGRVVGKAGAGLKAIREGSGGCKCEVQSEVLAGNFRRCNLGGTLDQISKASGLMLQKAFFQEPEPHQVSVLVADEWAGRVAGKGGENLRHLREHCKVKVTLEREHYGGERMVNMEGSVASLANAIRMFIQGGGRSAAAPPSMLAISAGGVVEENISGVRPVNQDPKVMQVHMNIHYKACGGIMGKGGEQLKHFEKVTGAKIAVSEHGGADRRVVIIGNAMQCAAAQKSVYSKICEMAPQVGIPVEDVTSHVMVRSEACGAIIGKAGENLRRIRENSGVKLNMGECETKGQRPVTLKGPLQYVLMAQQTIYEILKDQPMSAPYDQTRQTPMAKKRPAPSNDIMMGGYQAPARNALMGAKRARTDPVVGDGESIKMLIPSQAAGVIIGKQGSGLKQIRESTGVKIDVVKQEQTPHYPSDRIACLTGPSQSKHAAIDMILKAITPEHEYNNTTMKLLVPSQSSGKVIGKQAQTIKSIRESYGVQMQVERQEVYGDRQVSVQGMLSAVSAATSRILSALE